VRKKEQRLPLLKKALHGKLSGDHEWTNRWNGKEHCWPRLDASDFAFGWHGTRKRGPFTEEKKNPVEVETNGKAGENRSHGRSEKRILPQGERRTQTVNCASGGFLGEVLQWKDTDKKKGRKTD